MPNHTLLRQLLLFTLFTTLVGCGANLHQKDLIVGLVDEDYSDTLYATDDGWNWDLFSNTDIVFAQTDGWLPDGVYLSGNGVLYGTPAEMGLFDFEAVAYAITDDGYDWINDYWDDGSVTSDSEWFSLFVTERSTNSNCPAPDDLNTTAIYLCAADVGFTELANGDEFAFDITFFADFDEIKNYAITSVDFTISYDPEFFTVNTSNLTSQLLREAASQANASVVFDTSIAGELRVIVTAATATFEYSGRFVDLIFTAAQDVPAGGYDFILDINSIARDDSIDDGVTLPDIYIADGWIDVGA